MYVHDFAFTLIHTHTRTFMCFNPVFHFSTYSRAGAVTAAVSTEEFSNCLSLAQIELSHYIN